MRKIGKIGTGRAKIGTTGFFRLCQKPAGTGGRTGYRQTPIIIYVEVI
jgi:hypothetical protein